MKGWASLADRAKGPVHALLHEVPIVIGRTLNERQQGEKPSVRSRAVVDGQTGDQRKRRPFDELVLGPGPHGDLSPSERRLVEEVHAGGVADGPIVEAGRP